MKFRLCCVHQKLHKPVSGVVAVDARQEASGDCAGLMAASGLMMSSLQSSSIGLDCGSERVEHAALGSLPTA